MFVFRDDSRGDRSHSEYTYFSKPNVLSHPAKRPTSSALRRKQTGDAASSQRRVRLVEPDKNGLLTSDSLQFDSLGQPVETHQQSHHAVTSQTHSSQTRRRSMRRHEVPNAASSEEEPVQSKSRPRRQRHARNSTQTQQNSHQQQNTPAQHQRRFQSPATAVHAIAQQQQPVTVAIEEPDWLQNTNESAPLTISRKSLREIPGPVDRTPYNVRFHPHHVSVSIHMPSTCFAVPKALQPCSLRSC